jgi:hypothetical protein
MAAALLFGVANASSATFMFIAFLSGPNENPPNASSGTGRAFVTWNDVSHLMSIDATFSGLTGTTTAAHIHCCVAPPGSAGVATTTPSFAGFPLGVTSGTFSNTLDMTQVSSYNPAFISANGGTAETAEAVLLAGLKAGQTYFNIHTSVFPGGEIRGFLVDAGTLSVCKAAGPGISAGDVFTFTVGGNPYSVAAGSCTAIDAYAVGTDVTVTETVPAGDHVTSITVSGPGLLKSSNLGTGTGVVTIGSGPSSVTFTNSTVAAVQLRRLAATRSGKSVRLQWRTASESSVLGFKVFRGSSASRTKASRALILARGGVGGAAYSWRDRRPGSSSLYWLQIVESDGSTSWYGPARVH